MIKITLKEGLNLGALGLGAYVIFSGQPLPFFGGYTKITTVAVMAAAFIMVAKDMLNPPSAQLPPPPQVVYPTRGTYQYPGDGDIIERPPAPQVVQQPPTVSPQPTPPPEKAVPVSARQPMPDMRSQMQQALNDADTKLKKKTENLFGGFA